MVGAALRRCSPRSGRLDRLTPLELDVALAAGDGASLYDVAYGLFLGTRTARLLHASAMAKLGAQSTAELSTALGPERSPDAEVEPSRDGDGVGCED